MPNKDIKTNTKLMDDISELKRRMDAVERYLKVLSTPGSVKGELPPYYGWVEEEKKSKIKKDKK